MGIGHKRSKKEESFSSSLPTEEEKEAFARDFHDIKSLCWICDRIAKKINEQKELSEADGYHMSACLPAIMSIRVEAA